MCQEYHVINVILGGGLGQLWCFGSSKDTFRKFSESSLRYDMISLIYSGIDYLDWMGKKRDRERKKGRKVVWPLVEGLGWEI